MMTANKRAVVGDVIWYAVLIIGAVTMLMPLAWMVSTSLKEAGEVFTYPPGVDTQAGSLEELRGPGIPHLRIWR